MKKFPKFSWSLIAFLISAILALGGIAATYHAAYLSRPRKALDVVLHSPMSLVEIQPQAGEDIEVLYKGEKVENLLVVELSIQNRGNQPITEEDYAIPITFSFVSSVTVLDVVASPNPGDIDVVVTEISNSEVQMNPVLLNPDDSISIRFIVIGVEEVAVQDIEVNGRIVGVQKLEVHEVKESQPQQNLLLFLGSTLVGVFVTSVVNFIVLFRRLTEMEVKLAKAQETADSAEFLAWTKM